MVDTSEKLKAIEAELTAQEASLSAQLAALQAKLKAVRSVISMFSEDSSASETVESTPVEISEVTEEKTAPKKAATKAKATRKSAGKGKSSGKGKKNKDGRAATWQKYVRPGVKNESIPDAVKLVLSTQPEKAFAIAEVMEALFQDDMPRAQYLKARNRVSNVLSGGVRAGDWHRGGRSAYSIKEAG